MLTWDDEVKPASQIPLNTGSWNREVPPSPLSPAAFQQSATSAHVAQPAPRTLDDGARAPLAQPATIATRSAETPSHAA